MDQSLNLLKALPIPQCDEEKMVTQTCDGQQAMWKADIREQITMRSDWRIRYFDNVTELRKDRWVWEQLLVLFEVGLGLSRAGHLFASRYNRAIGHVDDELSILVPTTQHQEDDGIDLMIKSGEVARWESDMARNKAVIEPLLRRMVKIRALPDLMNRVVKKFRSPLTANLGEDGEKWWNDSVERTVDEAEQWASAPFTFAGLLQKIADKMKSKRLVVRVFADVLHHGWRSSTAQEIVFEIKDGEVQSRVKMAFVAGDAGGATTY